VGNIKAKLNVESIDVPTIIAGNINSFSLMIVDGELQKSSITSFIFKRYGEHEVEYVLAASSTIGEKAFKGCSATTEINIPNGVRSIGNSAFTDCINLEEINIPFSVRSIGNDAFNNCDSLPIIDNIRYAGSCAIEATDKTLESYELVKSTRHIYQDAFSGCTNMTNIEFPSRFKTIGDNAFNGCTSLKEIILQRSIESIGSYAFSGCSSLEYVRVELETPPEIGSGAFDDTSSELVIDVPCDSIDEYKSTVNLLPYSNNIDGFGCPMIAKLNIPNRNYVANILYDTYKSGVSKITIGNKLPNLRRKFIFVNGGIYGVKYSLFDFSDVGEKVLMGCKDVIEVDIPKDVERIGNMAFKDCHCLETFIVRAKIPPILEEDALKNTNISAIYVPSGSVDAYKSASGWSSYASRIQAIS
jgi:hypothetical protein